MRSDCEPMQSNQYTGRVDMALALSDFPCEEPTLEQLEAYLDKNSPILIQGGFGAATHGEIPPAIMALALAAETPEFPALTTSAERIDASPVEAAKHDQLCAKAARDRQASRLQVRAGLLEYHNQLAAKIEASLRPKAALRLKSHMAAHAVAGAPGCYAGGAMWRALEAMRTTVGVLEDNRDHDRAIEFMRDNPSRT